MKERILKLCKRLNKFSPADIETISGLNSEEVIYVLNELLAENFIDKRNGFYLYKNRTNEGLNRNKPPEIFRYYKKESIELVIKCFCADIPVAKVSLITNISNDALNVFYGHFRKALYKRQISELLDYYNQMPKGSSVHLFFGRELYFYLYDKNVYISDKELKTKLPTEKYTKSELGIIHNFYCKLRRVFNNYSYTKSLAPIAYSKLWLQLKNQDEKLSEMYKLFNINT